MFCKVSPQGYRSAGEMLMINYMLELLMIKNMEDFRRALRAVCRLVFVFSQSLCRHTHTRHVHTPTHLLPSTEKWAAN